MHLLLIAACAFALGGCFSGYRVGVLYPVMVFVLIVVLVNSVATQSSLHGFFANAAVTMAMIQVGYVVTGLGLSAMRKRPSV